MSNRMIANQYRTSVICVDRYEGKIPQGRMYHPSRTEGTAFEGLMQLLLQMEALLDTMNFPQSFTAKRAFGAREELDAAASVEETARTGKRATFAVRVLFRQNASWQGSVSWLEGGREESFRSVLELLLLMDSALGEP